MTIQNEQQQRELDAKLEEMVAASDTGARSPAGAIGKLIAGLALVWSLLQLYTASPLGFTLAEYLGSWVVLDSTKLRPIHMAFALVLAALAYPLLKSSPRDRIPWYDWLLAGLGAMACLYLIVFSDDIATRAGLPTTADLVMSTIGLAVLLIATYRALGLPLVLVASFFLVYVFFGDRSFIPEVIQWKGASYGKAMWHFWMQTEGVFGVAVGVSASMIFLFVLFGACLEKAGAGNYFVKVAFALLGHLRGGPAKAAVVSSAMTGLISGSSIANTVTTGTFTIPLMKRVGFSAEKSGSVEVASSVNGQLMPPIMGAAAFLMVEYVGVTYIDVVRHAVLPAVISYIALLYLVHLEAVKAGMEGLPKPGIAKTALQRLIGVLTGFIVVAVLAGALHFGLGWTKAAFGDATIIGVSLLFIIAYIVLTYLAAGYPDLELDDPNAPVTSLPEVKPTVMSGLYFLLPIVVLIWCLMIERFSPGLSAFWATIAMLFIQITQHPLKSMMRRSHDFAASFRQGWDELIDGLITGARNMIGIAVATGAAGIIVGTVTLTGFHQVMGEFVEFLSAGSLMLMLVLVAFLSLILGMGLPTTANYIVVSSLMASVVVEIGAQNGLIVPLIAVHLFVFYFGIMADVTPPVGLASFAAAAISGGDPIKTGFTAFFYSLRTVVLPFLFIFNTELLLIDVTVTGAIFVFIKATVAILIFAAATQGYFFARNKIWESLALLLIAFTLFRPGFWLDQVEPPFEQRPPSEIVSLAAEAPPGAELRVVAEAPDFNNPGGPPLTKTIVLPLGEGADGETRLSNGSGLLVMLDGDQAILEEPFDPGSIAGQAMRDFDFYGDEPARIVTVEVPADRLPKEVFYIPALLLLGIIIVLQRRRTDVPPF